MAMRMDGFPYEEDSAASPGTIRAQALEVFPRRQGLYCYANDV